MKTAEKSQNSISDTIALYKQELITEKRELKAAIRRTTCILMAHPLQLRLAEVNDELEKLKPNRFVGVENEFELLE